MQYAYTCTWILERIEKKTGIYTLNMKWQNISRSFFYWRDASCLFWTSYSHQRWWNWFKDAAFRSLCNCILSEVAQLLRLSNGFNLLLFCNKVEANTILAAYQSAGRWEESLEMLCTTFPKSSLRASSISFNSTMTSVLRGKQWPLVLELMMEMRQRTTVVMWWWWVGHVERHNWSCNNIRRNWCVIYIYIYWEIPRCVWALYKFCLEMSSSPTLKEATLRGWQL